MADDANRRSTIAPIGVSSVIKRVRPHLGDELVAACTVEPGGTYKRYLASVIPLGSLFIRRNKKLPKLMTLALTRDRLYLYKVALMGKARHMGDWPVAATRVSVTQGKATATIGLLTADMGLLEVEARTWGAGSPENKAFVEALTRTVPGIGSSSPS